VKEGQRKTVRGLIVVQSFHHHKNLSLLKSSLHTYSPLITNRIKRKTTQIRPPAKLFRVKAIVKLQNMLSYLCYILIN
jgi:hypothetical protein